MSSAYVLWIGYDDIPDENKWRLIDQLVDRLILDSNWTQLPDSGLTFTEQTAWLEYRQDINSLRSVFTKPDDVVIPPTPSGV